jgi:glyoxylase I family protein
MQLISFECEESHVPPNLRRSLVFSSTRHEPNGAFYTALLEEPCEADGYIMYMVRDTRLFFTPSVDQASPYNKEDVGLNHIALGVRTIEELQRVESQLNEGSVAHSGIKLWQDGLTKYIWLDDPDGIRVEYWLRLP